MFPFIAMTVGCLLGGVVSDWIAARFGLRMGRCLLPGVALALTAVLLLLGSSARNAQTAALILASAVGVLYLAQSNFWAVSADIAGEYTGIVSGMMNMGGQIGGACHRFAHPLDRRTLRMEHGLRGVRVAGGYWRIGMDCDRPESIAGSGSCPPAQRKS